MSAFATIPEAIEEIRRGRLVIVVDDEDRENEGDLVIAAQAVTPEAINFMPRFGRGLICVPVTADRLAELDLPLMVDVNTSRLGTAFTVSVDSREGTTTGISTFDRATTIKALADPRSRPEDLLRPGPLFPLRAVEGGVGGVTRRGRWTWRVWPGSRRSASFVRFWRTTGTWPACRGWRSSPASTDSGLSPPPT